MNVPSKWHFKHKRKRGRGKICCHLEATNQQGSGTGSTTAHKGSAASGTQNTTQGHGGLNERRLDQGFQTRKSFNSQMFTERKIKGSTGHNKAFHAVKYSGMSHSLIFDDAALDPSCFLHPEKSLHG